MLRTDGYLRNGTAEDAISLLAVQLCVFADYTGAARIDASTYRVVLSIAVDTPPIERPHSETSR